MAMSNAELEVALKAALQRLVTALANKVAPDSLMLEGKSLAEITSLILAGNAATAGYAYNAQMLGGKNLPTIESERNTQLVAAIDALRTELESDIGNVTAESIGLGSVVNYGVATEAEALAGAADKYVTAMLAVKIAQTKIDEIVNAAPETLNTLSEIAAALNNDPDVINTLMSNIGTNATAIEALDTAVQAFEAKVMGYFDVDGNANNANLFAGKTLDEVLALARDGVDMSNVVLKTDDFGQYVVGMTSRTPEIVLDPVFVDGMVFRVTRTDGNTTVEELYEGTWSSADWLSAEEQIAIEGALDAIPAVDGTTYYGHTFTYETVNNTILGHLEEIKGVAKGLDQKVEGYNSGVNQRIDGVQNAVSAFSESLNNAYNQLDTNKVGRQDNIGQNTLFLGEETERTEVALDQVIADIHAAIAAGGTASNEGLAELQAALDAFIAAKATGEDTIAGTDDSKYVTALTLKAALDELVVYKGDDLGIHPVAVLSDTATQEVPVLVATADTATAVIRIQRVATEVTVTMNDGGGNWVGVTEEQVGAGWSMVEEAIVAQPEGDFDQYFTQGVEEREVTAAARTLKALIEGLQAADKGLKADLDGQINGVKQELTNGLEAAKGYTDGVQQALNNWTESIVQNLDQIHTRIDGVVADKLDKTGNADQVTLTVEDAQVALADVIAQLRQGIAEAGDATELQAVRDQLEAFIAGKATAEEAAAGLDNIKYMTPAAAKAAFDARWAEKVGAAPETLDTIEEIALALRNNPDSLAAVETVAKQYTDNEVLAAIAQISGEDMEAGTTLASLYAQIQQLNTDKLDATAQAVDSAKLEGKSLSDVIDSAIQPGRLFYPVVHVNGRLDEVDFVMPTPAEVWADVKTNAVLEQVDTIYAIGVKRLLPGNLLALTNQEGMTLRGAVSEAQEGPAYVIMRAGIEATEWEVVNEPMLGCLARLSKHCIVEGENTERFVPGQTLFYNGFEALTEGVYYDWTLMADKEWEVATLTDTTLVIDSARYHRAEIRVQAIEPVAISFDVETDLPFEMEVRVVNMTGVPVSFVGSNVVSVPRMEEYTMTKVNGVVRIVRYTNTVVSVAGDLDEAFFPNPDYTAV